MKALWQLICFYNLLGLRHWEMHCLAKEKVATKDEGHTLLTFRWTAFSFDDGTNSLWHCFNKLLQCHETDFHPVLHSSLPTVQACTVGTRHDGCIASSASHLTLMRPVQCDCVMYNNVIKQNKKNTITNVVFTPDHLVSVSVERLHSVACRNVYDPPSVSIE